MEIIEKKIDTSDELADLSNNIESKLPKIDKLPTLANDPYVKSATEKITAKCLEWKMINKLFLNQEVFKNKKVSVYTDQVLKTNPELRFFISSNLWINKNFMNKKYEQLLAGEKIKLLALYSTLNNKVYQLVNPYKNENGKIDTKKFEKAYTDSINWIVSNLAIDFKLTQLSNLWNIKKTLKQDYKLTDKEITQYIAYLEELKKQPSNVQEAGGWGYIAAFIAGVVLTLAGVFIYNRITHPRSETITNSGRVEIGDPRTIAKLLAVDAPFKTTWTIKKEQFKINDDDNSVIQWLKKAANIPQSSEIVMEVDGKLAIQFDLDNSTFVYDYSTKKIYAHLKKPQIIITDFNPKIFKKNWEVFEIKKFDNIQPELMSTLKQDVLKDAWNRRDILEKARKNTETILKNLYTIAFSGSGRKLEWVEVTIDDFDDPSYHIEPQDKKINIKTK